MVQIVGPFPGVTMFVQADIDDLAMKQLVFWRYKIAKVISAVYPL